MKFLLNMNLPRELEDMNLPRVLEDIFLCIRLLPIIREELEES